MNPNTGFLGGACLVFMVHPYSCSPGRSRLYEHGPRRNRGSSSSRERGHSRTRGGDPGLDCDGRDPGKPAFEHALGDQTTEEEREQIAKKSFENLFISMGEMIHMDQIMNKWQDHCRIDGGEIVDKLVDDGKGFMVFGGHFGGWTMPAFFPKLFPELPGINIVARPVRNPKIQSMLDYIVANFKGKINSWSCLTADNTYPRSIFIRQLAIVELPNKTLLSSKLNYVITFRESRDRIISA